MEIKELEMALESVLFASGEPVSVDKLAETFGVDIQTMRAVINKLSDYYDYEKRGIKITRLENSIQLCTRADYHDYVTRALSRPRQSFLSQAALEVLAIIAYNQPVTKFTIENIRGVDSSNTVAKLIERGLVEEKGRLQAPGKPFLYGTTKDFLRCFCISSLDELPDIKGITLDENNNTFIE